MCTICLSSVFCKSGAYLLAYVLRLNLRILLTIFPLNLLQPTGYVMHHQFNIQQL